MSFSGKACLSSKMGVSNEKKYSGQAGEEVSNRGLQVLRLRNEKKS